MYEYEENLFGVDMRHRPPLTIMPTEEHGWGGSHGRLAYSQMNRAKEWNYSEYAVNTMGLMPKNYIIVNVDEVRINKNTAFKVGHKRAAIPVKEFARQKHLSLKEQWELMNSQWIGTFFGYLGEDPYRNRRPSLEQAMSDAMDQNRYDEFMSQFWSAEYGHKKAVERLERRAKDLDNIVESLNRQRTDIDRHLFKAESDINKGQLKWFHELGINAHDYLHSMKRKRLAVNERLIETQEKVRRIRYFLSSITY